MIRGEFLNDQHVARNFCSRYGAICGALFGNKIKLKVIKDEIEPVQGGNQRVTYKLCVFMASLGSSLLQNREYSFNIMSSPVRDSESMLYPIF